MSCHSPTKIGESNGHLEMPLEPWNSEQTEGWIFGLRIARPRVMAFKREQLNCLSTCFHSYLLLTVITLLASLSARPVFSLGRETSACRFIIRSACPNHYPGHPQAKLCRYSNTGCGVSMLLMPSTKAERRPQNIFVRWSLT